MDRYKNLSGDSGVSAYELGRDGITVEFNDGKAYLYTTRSAGASHLARMQHLAKSGQGLTTYINRFVKEKYARRLR